MGPLDALKNKLARRSLDNENLKLKLARNALARALDDEAERLNGGKALAYGSMKAPVGEAAQEAQDLGSYVRKLDPRDRRIEQALEDQEAGLLTPLADEARKVLAEPWPGGFDADAKLDAVIKALHTSAR